MQSNHSDLRTRSSKSVQQLSNESCGRCGKLVARFKAVALASAATVLCGLAVGTSTASAALIAYYPLEGNLTDVSGNGNNGTAGGTLTFGNGGLLTTGSNANEFFTAPVNVNIPQVTFGGWFETTAINPVRGLIANDTGGFGRGIDIDNRNGTNGYAAFAGPSTGVFGQAGGVTPTAGGFDFVAVTYNTAGSGTATLDVNGTIFHDDGHSPSNGFDDLTIGKNPSFDMPFGGTIKGVFIYDTALTPAQLNALQAQGVLPEPTSWLLMGLGSIGLFVAARRRRKA